MQEVVEVAITEYIYIYINHILGPQSHFNIKLRLILIILPMDQSFNVSMLYLSCKKYFYKSLHINDTNDK